MKHEKFLVGEIYNVTFGNTTVQTVVSEAGTLTASVTGMSGASVVGCQTEGKTFTFNNVIPVTVLRTAEDLKKLNAYTASGHITGYYILGNNIDCTGVS